jgi:hypothetical protein
MTRSYYSDSVQPPRSRTTVRVLCRVTGFRVADGDTWWYPVDSKPWNCSYYGSDDAFYNNGRTSGSLHGTPLVEQRVPKYEG